MGGGAGSGAGAGGGWRGGVDRVWTQTVKLKDVECLGKTPFGKAKSLVIILVLFMGGLFILTVSAPSLNLYNCAGIGAAGSDFGLMVWDFALRLRCY